MADGETGALGTRRIGGALVLSIENAAKRNALTPAILAALDAALETAERDAGLRCLIVTGAGGTFCAGADIRAWGALTPLEFSRAWIRGGHRLFDRLARFRAPTIAAIDGRAYGGGLELAAACDIRVASAGAEFALPEAGIGVAPGWSGLQRLARQLPPPVVRHMALGGARLDARRMFALGFLAEIAEGDALEAALAQSERMASLSPVAQELAKLVLNAEAREGAEAALDALAGGFAAASEDKAEGVRAFGEKRPPEFPGS